MTDYPESTTTPEKSWLETLDLPETPETVNTYDCVDLMVWYAWHEYLDLDIDTIMKMKEHLNQLVEIRFASAKKPWIHLDGSVLMDAMKGRIISPGKGNWDAPFKIEEEN